MRIDNKNPLDPFLAAEAAKSRPSKPGGAKGVPDAAPVVAGQTQALIQQALAAPEVRPQAVADARQLIDTGQLESDQAFHRLAERLTDLGV